MGTGKRTPEQMFEFLVENFDSLSAELVSDIVADDCELHEAQALPVGGVWRGPQGFVDVIAAIKKAFPNFAFELETVLTDGNESLCVKGTNSWDGPDGRISMPLIEFWTIRNGKVVEITPAWHDTKLAAETAATQ